MKVLALCFRVCQDSPRCVKRRGEAQNTSMFVAGSIPVLWALAGKAAKSRSAMDGKPGLLPPAHINHINHNNQGENKMARGNSFWRAQEKKSAVKNAEDSGSIADSMEVRKELMRKVRAGEITLEQAQSELAAIKRNAARQGKSTRAQVWGES